MSEIFGWMRDKLHGFSSRKLNTDITPESKPLKTQEEIERSERLNQHVDTGVNFLKEKEYSKTIKHFTDKGIPKEKDLGVKVSSESPVLPIFKEKINEMNNDVIDNLAQEMAMASHHLPRENEVKVVDLVVYDSQNPKEQGSLDLLPEKLLQEAALLATEEWLHARQKNQGSLTGEPDHELDIAKYYKQEGIDMTDNFLSRHNRREALEK